MKQDHLIGGLALLTSAVAIAYFYKRPPRLPSTAAAIPPVTIDPRVYLSDMFEPESVPPAQVPAPRPARSGAQPQRRPPLPQEQPAFGNDRLRNEDDITIDDYMNLPLVGAAKTHKNRNALADLDEVTIKPSAQAFQYFRLKVLKTRSPTATKVALGGVELRFGEEAIAIPGTLLWNPHTGQKTPMNGPIFNWEDDDQKELIWYVPMAVEVTAYRLRTSAVASTDEDPVQWRLEGSLNGVYWTTLDDRSSEETFFPIERGAWFTYAIPAASSSSASTISLR